MCPETFPSNSYLRRRWGGTKQHGTSTIPREAQCWLVSLSYDPTGAIDCPADPCNNCCCSHFAGSCRVLIPGG